MTYPIETNDNMPENYISLIFKCNFNKLLGSKSKSRPFTEINNDFVHKRLSFTVNGHVHKNCQLFNNNIRFEIDAKQIIKSIQFKLDDFKKTEMSQQKNHSFQKKCKFISSLIINKGEFFAVEFVKKFPNFKSLEDFHTNFNSIVNSGITITKFYINFQYDINRLSVYTSKSLLRYDSENKFNSYNQGYYYPYQYENECEYNIYEVNSFNMFSSRGSKFKDSLPRKSYNKNSIESPQGNSSGSTYPTTQILLSSPSFSTKFTFSINTSPSLTEIVPKSTLPHNLPINHYDVMTRKYEGFCNFLLFAKQSSLYISKTNFDSLNEMKIEEYFNNFEQVASFGGDVSYIDEANQLFNINYSLSLSSMMVLIKYNKEMFELILGKISKKNYNKKYEDSNTITFEMNEKLSVIFRKGPKEIKIYYNETKLPHYRKLITEQIEEIMTICEIQNAKIGQFDKGSWFCFYWQPTYYGKNKFAISSFLVYYQFTSVKNSLCEQGYDNYLEIPLIGILPIRMEESIWLKRIKKQGNIIFSNYNFDFSLALEDSIANVNNFIFKLNEKPSTDYDFYTRNIQKNY